MSRNISPGSARRFPRAIGSKRDSRWRVTPCVHGVAVP
jgi:hypothetical protein